MSDQYSRSGPSGSEIYGRGPTPDSGAYTYGRGVNRSSRLPQYQYDSPSSTPVPAPTSNPPPLPPAPEPIDPKELAAVLFGQNIPIAIGSSLQIGGRIIEGPQYLTLDGASSVNAVSFIAGYYIPINYNTTGRAVTELWFRGQKAWTEDDGSLMPPTAPVLTVGGATTGTEQRVRFTTGVLDQAADAWSIGRHGAANALAYRPMVTGIFENIRIEQFGHLIPFTSVTVTDSEWGDPGDLVPWSSLIEYLAQMDMRWSNLYSIRDFDTLDVTGGVQALILGSPIYFTEFLAGMRKVKPYWHLRTEDRLWVIEKGPYSLDLTVEMSKVQARGGDPVTIHMADAKENNQEVLVSYLDSDRDYERTTVRAAMELNPIQTTDAFKSETVNVPVVSTMDEMIVAANLALFSQDMEREQSEFTGLAPYLGMQPGDTMAIPTDERTYFHAAFEVVRKPDLTTEVKARGFLTCAAEASLGNFIVTGQQFVSPFAAVIAISNNGTSWTQQSLGDSSERFLRRIADDDLRYVAVGFTAPLDAAIFASLDGQTWSDQSPTIVNNTELMSVCSSGTKFVAVGIEYTGSSPSTNRALCFTSPDGLLWTQQTVSSSPRELWGVAYGGSTFVAVGNKEEGVNPPCIFTSPDGVTWTERTPSYTDTALVVDVAYSSDLSLFIAGGWESNGGDHPLLMTSPDGITWTNRTPDPATNGYIEDIHCENGLCVAVGRTTSGTLVPIIMTSTNGTSWTARTPDPSTGCRLLGVGYSASGGLWFAVGRTLANVPIIMTSPNGTTWTQRTPAPTADTGFWGALGN